MMNRNEELKELVKEKYSQLANKSLSMDEKRCCSLSNQTENTNLMGDSYDEVEGYVKNADLGLGCGLPTETAGINPGDTVLDLGSGAGNDCFIARYETGELGKVIGVDFSESMVERARINALKLGFNNVEFRSGDIENLPVVDGEVDVIVSNCVLNLVPNKQKVFQEIFRALKPGGHFSISDIVIRGDVPKDLKIEAEAYAGCVAGAIEEKAYLDMIRFSGFTEVQVVTEKVIELPEETIKKYYIDYDPSTIDAQIMSFTVTALKPVIESVETIVGKEVDKACC